jgi:hypothetical protein
MSTLDRLYTCWMDAETAEQAAMVLHGAYATIESLALLEIAVERTESARTRYLDEIARCGEGTIAVPAGPALVS